MEQHQYKVCVYAITKNEERQVDGWLDSMNEADQVVVTDTGSQDRTVEKLRRRGAAVFVESIDPWRFDTARNRSLSHVPEDTDICVCTDLDERFRSGWRACLERAWTPDTLQGEYLYNWSLKENGEPGVQFVYSKVHARQAYAWNYPVHEYLKYQGKGAEKKVFIEGMILNHYPDPAKKRDAYLPLLEMAVAEDPEGDRMTYYLGREYMYQGRWRECADTLKRHLTLPAARWPEERCASMRWIAAAYEQLGQIQEACRWYYRAIAEAPHMRDAYIEFGRMAYRLGDWETVFFMTAAALKIKERSSCYVNMEYAWDETPDDLAALACYRLELYERAWAHAEKALSFDPVNERLKENLAKIGTKLGK